MTTGTVRVALAHWAFPPTTGGVESHLADLARLLSHRGCDVCVLTGERDPIGSTAYDIVSVPSLSLEASGRDCGASLVTAVERLRPHVVHGHNLHHFHPEPAHTLDGLRAQIGFSLHHTFHETWPDVLHRDAVYRRWDVNWAVSGHVQDECSRRLGFRPRLLRLPVDTDRFRAGRTPLVNGRRPVILHPARLLPWKGVHVSVAMVGELRRRGLDAVLVVTDTQRIADWDDELSSYRGRVLEEVRAHELEDHVRFVSSSYADMPGLYEDADIVVYPTVGEEPYGLVPLEAMSCARPIVASRSGGIPETVVDGETGFLVDRGDAVALADHVAMLLEDPALAATLGAQGRQRVLAEFGVDRFVDTLLDAYTGGRR
jgi:glycosyltransferase involved in cell wall biosynthesis